MTNQINIREYNTINGRETTHFDYEDDYRTVNNNIPIQDYVHLDDQTQPTFEMTPGLNLSQTNNNDKKGY